MDTVVNNANLLALMNQIKQKRAAGENFGPQRQTKAGPVETPGWLPQAAASLPLRALLCLLGCFCLGGAQNAAATQFNAIAHALANNVATQGADYGCRSGSNRNRGYTACQRDGTLSLRSLYRLARSLLFPSLWITRRMILMLC